MSRAVTDRLIALALDVGFTQAGVILVTELRFEEEIRQICAGNGCRNYGKSWACPPAVGTLAECRARCSQYEHMLLLNRCYAIEDSFDFEGMVESGRQFKQLVEDFELRVEKVVDHYQLLSNEGCGRCKICTYPHAPCRYPKRLYHSLEGYGFNVSELAKKAGMRYMDGADTVTYFGALLY